MTSIFEEVRAERAALLKAIGSLHPVALDRPGVVGEWSIKDVLAHIAGWQNWMARALPIRLERGDLPDDLRVTEHNTGDWNRKFVDERRANPPDKVIEDLNDGLRYLLTLAANLGSTRLNAPGPWSGREASIADYLRDHIVAHDREHREQIEQALSVTRQA
ncbi:MAG: maleylpyruvate isomerase N-terminal domain-containing protein [Chloroflexi bacterium]|nr:maleylpyruvate isomerase N-terminal domain-containing protein [Chloroflexota bacterium]